MFLYLFTNCSLLFCAHMLLTNIENLPIIIYYNDAFRGSAVSFLSLNKEWLEYGHTTLANAFVLEYLPNTSNADYIKVYLYGLMHAQAGNSDLSARQIAEALGFAEEDVVRAFRYWERRKLVLRVQDKPLRFEYLPAALANQYADSSLSRQYQELNDVLYALFGEKRLLHGSEISMVQEWIEDLTIPLEVVMIFLQYTINMKGYHFSFHAANKEIVKMKDAGVSGIDEVESYLSGEQEYSLGAKSVLNRFRNYRNPTEDEIVLYKKWRKELQLSHEDILEACRETTKGNASFAYLDGILKGLTSRSGSGKNIKELIQSDEQETAEAKAVLTALGMADAKRNITAGVKAAVQALQQSYSKELILHVCGVVALRGGKMSDLAQELEFLRKANVSSAEEARAYYAANTRTDKLLRGLYDALGIKREPNSADRQTVLQWQSSYGFSEEIIYKCAEYARDKQMPIPYMQKILESWHARGLNTLEKIEEARQKFLDSRDKDETKPEPPRKKRVLHQDYQQREYAETDYNFWQPDFNDGETT